MNDAQRKQVQTLRKENKSYGAIASLLGISVSTIKTYCIKHGLGGDATKALPRDGEERHCIYCGSPVIQIPGKKEKRFCSTFCRTKWWSSHRSESKKNAYYEYVCPGCNKTFTVYAQKHRKYCCHECYVKARFGGDAR